MLQFQTTLDWRIAEWEKTTINFEELVMQAWNKIKNTMTSISENKVDGMSGMPK